MSWLFRHRWIAGLAIVFALAGGAMLSADGPDGKEGDKKESGQRDGERGPGGPPSAEKIFERIDANKDGSISKEEFTKAHEARMNMMRERFAQGGGGPGWGPPRGHGGPGGPGGPGGFGPPPHMRGHFGPPPHGGPGGPGGPRGGDFHAHHGPPRDGDRDHGDHGDRCERGGDDHGHHGHHGRGHGEARGEGRGPEGDCPRCRGKRDGKDHDRKDHEGKKGEEKHAEENAASPSDNLSGPPAEDSTEEADSQDAPVNSFAPAADNDPV